MEESERLHNGTVNDFNSFKKLVKEQLKSLKFLPNCGKRDDFISVF